MGAVLEIALELGGVVAYRLAVSSRGVLEVSLLLIANVETNVLHLGAHLRG